jgi:hypothetical protein
MKSKTSSLSPKKKEAEEPAFGTDNKLREEADKYKQEVERLKAELEKTKASA